MSNDHKGKLIYSMLVSLDGYTEDKNGKFGWGAPEDEEVHAYINALSSSIKTYLYGRRMYDTMVYWETAHTVPGQPKVILEYARVWQSAEKIVFSRTLSAPRSARTRIERNFDPEFVKQLKHTGHDISVDGPELASHAIRAGLVDEFHLIVCPAVVGGGKKFFPEDVQLNLALVGEKHFTSGVVVLQYANRGS